MYFFKEGAKNEPIFYIIVFADKKICFFNGNEVKLVRFSRSFCVKEKWNFVLPPNITTSMYHKYTYLT